MVRTQGHVAMRNTVGTSSHLEINTREWLELGTLTPKQTLCPCECKTAAHPAGKPPPECDTRYTSVTSVTQQGTACSTHGLSVTTEGKGAGGSSCLEDISKGSSRNQLQRAPVSQASRKRAGGSGEC